MREQRIFSSIIDLPNLGSKSVEMLKRVGITTVEELQRIGSIRAYYEIKKNMPSASLNLLWALEGALTNRTWQEVARYDRTRLLFMLDDLEKTNSE